MSRIHVAGPPQGLSFVPQSCSWRICSTAQRHAELLTSSRKTGELAIRRPGVATREGFSSAPVAVGNSLFFTNDVGLTFVVEQVRSSSCIT